MKNQRVAALDWALWFYWIMASTAGWVIGTLLFAAIPIVTAGAAIAALQWAVLHGRIHHAWRWGIFSAAGWIGGYILFLLFFSRMGVPLGPLMGLSLGIPQWLILKKEVQWAGWWIVMSLIGWTTGLTLLPGLLTSGALPGAWTGLTLILLFKYPTTPSHPSSH